MDPGWRWVTAPWASGKHSSRSSGRRATSATGYTRRPTYSTSCKGLQKKAKAHLQEIWRRRTGGSLPCLDAFIALYEAKYPKAGECLQKDRKELLAFYDFPAAHWQYIRTTNPIESTFATVRLRTAKTRGCVSRKSIHSLVYRLELNAQKRWRRLRGFKHLAEVIEGARFGNGVRAKEYQDT